MKTTAYAVVSTGTHWGSGSFRPGTILALESTRSRVNSAASSRPVYFSYGKFGLCVPNMNFGRYILVLSRDRDGAFH